MMLSVMLALVLMLALVVGLLLGGLLARRGAERRARAAWSAAALASLTDVSAADLKRILGHLPPWVRDAEFQKVRDTRLCCAMRASEGLLWLCFARCALTLTRIGARRWRG